MQINQGAHHDNGLTPVLLLKYYKNNMPGEVCGLSHKDALRLCALDPPAAEMRYKFRVVRDGEHDGQTVRVGEFLALDESAAKKMDKLKNPIATRCKVAGDDAPEAPAKPE